MARSRSQVVKTSFTRLFTIEGAAGPANVPAYQGQARVMGPSWSLGDRTPVRQPGDRYGAFDVVDAIKGERGLPTVSVEARYPYTASEFLRLARIGCVLDLQVHMGKCQDPRDFDGGWDKILAFEGADFSNWAASELGALEQGQDANVTETPDFNALDMYEIVKLVTTEIGGSQIVQEIVDVAICDSIVCGNCGIPSDGCQTVFGLSRSHGGSPGLPAEIIWSANGGATMDDNNITSLLAAEDPSALACVGTRLAVVSNESCSVHYATIAEILLQTETWVENASGLVCAAGAPNDIFSLDASHTWVVGNGGYIYKYTDITAAAVPQHSGTLTVQNLNAIHGIDDQNLVAVGGSNAVLVTNNGGETWALVVGPAVGIVLNTVWMKSELEWFIGTAGGRLYYTRNGGDTWTEKAFSGSGAGSVHDIVFASPTVGYMAHSTAAIAGRVFRTVNGGYSWYLLPESVGSLPANDQINALAACPDDVNVFYGGGLADNATDGIMVKGA